MKLSNIFRDIRDRGCTGDELKAAMMKICAKRRHVYSRGSLTTDASLQQAASKLTAQGYARGKDSTIERSPWGFTTTHGALSFKKDGQTAIISFRQSAAQKKDGVMNAVIYRGDSKNTPLKDLAYVTLQKFLAEAAPQATAPAPKTPGPQG